MNLIQLTLIIIYFSIGSFTAGIYYSEIKDIPKLRLIIGMVIIILFGTTLHILGFIWFQLNI